jgi:hypothetical protein
MLYETFEALPDCVNHIGFYPPKNFDLKTTKKQPKKIQRYFKTMLSCNHNLIEATRQVIIKQFINTATDRVHKKAFELCLKNLDDMRDGNYPSPKTVYPLKHSEQPYKKLWIVVVAMIIEDFDDLKVLSVINKYVDSYNLHFTVYQFLISQALTLKDFKMRNIPLNHSTRTKKLITALQLALHKINSVINDSIVDDSNLVNDLIKATEIPKKLIGNKEKYLRIPTFKTNKLALCTLNPICMVERPIELLLKEMGFSFVNQRINLDTLQKFKIEANSDNKEGLETVKKHLGNILY